MTNESVVEEHNSPEFNSESDLVTSLDMAMAMGQQYIELDSTVNERELKQIDMAIFNAVQSEVMYALFYIIEIKSLKVGNSLKEHIEIVGQYIENVLCDWDEIVAEIQSIIENLCDALGDKKVITLQNISLYLNLSE